jgi:hypothetical protein
MAKKKKRKVSKKSIEAGTKNLLEHRPKTPNLKHGLYSDAIFACFKDGRTREARQLKKRINSLIAEAGGPDQLSPAMWDCLARIRDVLKTLILAGNWIGRQPIDSLMKNGGLNGVFKKYLAAERRFHKLVTGFRVLIPKDSMKEYMPNLKELKKQNSRAK